MTSLLLGWYFTHGGMGWGFVMFVARIPEVHLCLLLSSPLGKLGLQFSHFGPVLVLPLCADVALFGSL